MRANLMSCQPLLKYGSQLAAAILLGAVTVVSGAEEQDKAAKDVPANKRAAAQLTVNYRPPLRDDSRAMEGTGNRSASGKAVMLELLAPDHVGLTTKTQPVLYWYARTPAAVNFEFTLLKKGATTPLLKTRVAVREGAGIHQLDLGAHRISLQPEVIYHWSVAVVSDESSQSGRLIAGGMIERMDPGEGLRRRIRKVRGIALVDVYAIEGLWYDALESISSMIEASPGDQSLAAVRTSLLEQAGLQASGQ